MIPENIKSSESLNVFKSKIKYWTPNLLSMPNLQNIHQPSWFYKLNFCSCWIHYMLNLLFFSDKILKILLKIIVKMVNSFPLKFYLFIVPYNALLYLAFIRPVFCIGAIAKPNWNKVCKKNQKKPASVHFIRYTDPVDFLVHLMAFCL